MNPSSADNVSSAHAADLAPSSWVVQHAKHIPAGQRVLDLACGGGRHARYLAAQGFRVDAVDRDLTQFVDVPEGVRLLAADLEGQPWPFKAETYAGAVVTNYLHRPLFPLLIDALVVGGVLIYETFARGNEAFGRPTRAEFLLEPGELLRAMAGRCTVLAFEEGYIDTPKPAVLQRMAAIKRPPSA
jgi:SAM-dependent methyltransferase